MNIQPKQSERARKRARELSRFPRAGRGRIAVVKGQDRTRWTDWYHLVLTVPWSVFFLGLAAAFCLISAVFALFYLASPGGINHARPLAEFIGAMSRLCRPHGGVFGAEYMMPVEPRHFTIEHYPGEGQVRGHLPG